MNSLLVPASLRSTFAHVGKQKQKWKFECQVCDVRGLPDGVNRAVCVWDRGKKAMMTSSVEVNDGYARWDTQLTTSVTLFRSSRTNSLDPKLCRLQVYDSDRMVIGQLSSKAGLLAAIQLDLSQYSLPGEAAVSSGKGKIIQLTLQPEISTAARIQPGGAPRVILLQVELRGHVSTAADEEDDDDASSVHSGSTLTTRDHVARRPPGATSQGERDEYESTVHEDDGPMQRGVEIDGSHERSKGLVWTKRGGGAKTLADAQSRVLTLEQQLATAQAQVQALESTIGILRHRLDVEVLEDIGATLERAKDARAQDAAAMYARQLVATSERLEALIVGDGPIELGGLAAEREVVQLRRQLVLANVSIAEVSQERDEYKHLMSKVGMQARELVDAERGRNGGRMGFGLGSMLGM